MKMKTLRESSKRLSKKYKFKRNLSSQPAITAAFRERDSRINRVSPVKDIVILEPLSIETLVSGDHVGKPPPSAAITKTDTDWPFRVEYVEQLLDVDCVWVVIADGRSPTGSYASSSGSAIPLDIGGINLDLIKVESPYVIKGDVRPIGTGRKLIGTEKALRGLEAPEPRLIRSVEHIWVQGKRPDQCVDIYLCNILPHHLTMYNCTFYNRDVAHLYLESLSEHIKRFVNNDNSSR